MMQLSRRNMLSSAALGAVALGVAACSSTQISQFEADYSNFVTQVQASISAAQKYIPTVESVAATLAGLFGPQWAGAVTFGTAILNQVVAAIESALGSQPTVAKSASLARLSTSSRGVPAAVGTIPGLIDPATQRPVLVTGFRS